MSEQREPHDVVFYCDPCARRYGSKRLLAAADRYSGPGPDAAQPSDGWPSDGWRFWLGRRGSEKVRMEILYTPLVWSSAGHPHGPRKPVGPALQPGGHRFVLVPLSMSAPAAQLICYRCPARPRVARTKLAELAEQTVAAGRRDAYI